MRNDEALVARLVKLDSSVMSDVLDGAGLPNQALAHFLRPLDPKARLAGVAFCATGRPIVAGGPKSALSMYELERRVGPGMVLVVDAAQEPVGAVIGGFMAATFKARGCTGMVVNGAVRDALELVELSLPTFTRFASPVNGGKRWELTGVDVPVALPALGEGSVTVSPGDFILGDLDGLVVMPRRFVPSLIEDGERLQAIEQAIRDEIRGGATREEAFARHPRFAHIRRVAD